MNRINKRRLFFMAFFLFTSFFLSMQTVFFPFSRRLDFNDSAIYQYIGYLITTGRTPYVDAFDHKGLYLYFLNAIGYIINPRWGMWLVIWAFMFTNMLLTFKIANKFVDVNHTLIITVIICTGLAAGFWDGDTPDHFSMAFNLASFYLISDYFRRKTHNRYKTILVGVYTAIAFWMKPNMIIGTGSLLLGIFVYILFENKNWRPVIHIIIFFIFGFILASIPALIWLFRHGALSAMYEDYFLFNFAYSAFHPSAENRMNAFAYFIMRPSIFPVFVCLLLLLFKMLSKQRSGDHYVPSNMVICGFFSFIVSLLFLIYPGNSYMNYVASLLPSCAIIYTSCGVELISLQSNKGIHFLLKIGLVVILALNIYQEYTHCRIFWNEIPQEQETKKYIVENSRDDDTIAIISPYYIGYYIATGRDSATKYPYIQANHFANAIENIEKERSFWLEYSDSLIETKPRMILFDRAYTDNETVSLYMNKALGIYLYSGQSTRFDFYVLPVEDNESVPKFVSMTPILDPKGIITIPNEMIEAYHRGEATFNDFMKLFDDMMGHGNGM